MKLELPDLLTESLRHANDRERVIAAFLAAKIDHPKLVLDYLLSGMSCDSFDAVIMRETEKILRDTPKKMSIEELRNLVKKDKRHWLALFQEIDINGYDHALRHKFDAQALQDEGQRIGSALQDMIYHSEFIDVARLIRPDAFE